MAETNTVVICGRLGKDPEFRETEGGDKLCSFSIANSTFKQVNEEWVEDTSWFDATAWGYTAEKLVERGKKGHRIIVTGNLKQRTWEAEDGTKREKVSINARNVQFLEKAPKKENAEPEKQRRDVDF